MRGSWWLFAALATALITSATGCSTDDDAADDDAADDDTGDDDSAEPPTYPNNHSTAWECYLCHEAAFNGSPAEPHGHGYASPTQCVTCHTAGDWTNGPHGNPGHNLDQDCLTCHAVQHDKAWQEKSQCQVCHQGDSGAQAPSYPQNHEPWWNCYICHETALLGVTKPEPHGHVYAAPAQCTTCHSEGTWNNPSYEEGHNWSQNCLTCHGSRHSRPWEEKNQCLVCHGEDESAVR